MINKTKIRNVENIAIKLFNLIVAPILLIVLPLYTALITLLIFFIANLIMRIIVNMKRKNHRWYRIDKWFDEEVLEYAIKTLTNYCLSILCVGLFETHILGMKVVEIAGMSVSLTRAVVILISAKEFGEVMTNLGKLTDYNVFDKLFRFMPDSLSNFFKKSIDYNKDDINNENKNDET